MDKPQLTEKPPLRHTSPSGEPSHAVGQEDSLTDQCRQNVSEEEQIAPAPYQPKDSNCLSEDTDLDESMVGDDPL